MIIEKKKINETMKRRQHKQAASEPYIIDTEWWILPKEHNVYYSLYSLTFIRLNFQNYDYSYISIC